MDDAPPATVYADGMKAALLADGLWINEEASTVRFYAVGLTDEQVRVVPVTPIGCQRPRLSLITERLYFRSSKVSWWRRTPRRLAEQLRELEVDLLHAMDGSIYPLARMLGAALEVPVICSCWSTAELARIALAGHDVSTVFVLPTPALAQRGRELLGEKTTIELVRPGVLGGSEEVAEPLADPESALCCLVIGDGKVDVDYLSLLRGVTMVRSRLPQLQLLLYAMGGDHHRLWQAASKLDLLGHVNLVDSAPQTRQLLVQADVLMVPQPLGAVRTVVLEAMAAKRPVIAAVDPMLDYLLEGKTARLIAEATADRWAEHFDQLVSMPRAFRSLGQSAAAYVKEHHQASRCVEQLLKIYRQATGEPLQFATPPDESDESES